MCYDKFGKIFFGGYHGKIGTQNTDNPIDFGRFGVIEAASRAFPANHDPDVQTFRPGYYVGAGEVQEIRRLNASQSA